MANYLKRAIITQLGQIGAPEAGQKLMEWKVATLARVANHWSMNTDTMGVYGKLSQARDYHPTRSDRSAGSRSEAHGVEGRDPRSRCEPLVDEHGHHGRLWQTISSARLSPNSVRSERRKPVRSSWSGRSRPSLALRTTGR